MPDAPEPNEDIEVASSATAEEERQVELLLAGFRACAKEAIRFLLEEEGLSPDHPLPAGLNEHLVRQQCNLAGALHNDSGVGLEESFIFSPTDSSTTRQETDCSNDSMLCEELDDINESQVSHDLSVIETVEQILHFINNEVEINYRTEMFETHE